MSVAFELDSEFFAREGLQLSVGDLRYGYKRGWLKPRTVIELAKLSIQNGGSDDLLKRLAELSHSDWVKVADILKTDLPDSTDDPALEVRKWLYFQLKAAFEIRHDFQDPLGIVEQLYADFDYPARMRSLIRYMPLEEGQSGGVDDLMQRWKAYLESEKSYLVAEGQKS